MAGQRAPGARIETAGGRWSDTGRSMSTKASVRRPFLATRMMASSLQYVGEVSSLFAQTLRALFRTEDPFPHMVSIGINTMPIALLTIAFSGMVLALYTARQMQEYGLGSFVGGLVAVTMTREMAPVLAAVVLAARAGSAIAAELGTMKVTEQIDALRSMATSPLRYLVVPRFIACVSMLPLLALFGMVVGTFGGYIVATTVGIANAAYLDSVRQFVTMGDVVNGMIKTVVFGAIIAMVACHQGLNTSGGASGVGAATTRSVVLCIIFVYAADFVIVRLFVAGPA